MICKNIRWLLPLLTIACFSGFAQGSNQKKQEKYEKLKTLIDSKKFLFQALQVTPTGGRTIQLTSTYYLKINSDTLRSDLPYYGRAYTSDYPATDLSIALNTTAFTYKADSSKKGWMIIIVPKNEPKANKINLSITTTGYATVQVYSINRQPVSYYGTIEDYPVTRQ